MVSYNGIPPPPQFFPTLLPPFRVYKPTNFLTSGKAAKNGSTSQEPHASAETDERQNSRDPQQEGKVLGSTLLGKVFLLQ